MNHRKTIFVTRNTNTIRAKEEKFERVNRFKYMCAIVTVEGVKPGVMSIIHSTSHSNVYRLNGIWIDPNISQESKLKRMRFMVISLLIYTCESWTIAVDVALDYDALDGSSVSGTGTISRTR